MMRSRHSESARTLFCIPHAGGGTAVYRDWTGDLAPEAIVKRLQLPGRESRFGEPALTTLDAALADLFRAAIPDLSGPFALFGHSMGALLAFELAHKLRESTAQEPVHLFVSACRAPHFPPLPAPYSDLPQKDFIDIIDRRYGGIPSVLLVDDGLMKALLPAIRADFKILERYRASDRQPLNCPISVFGGRDDTATPLSTLEAWREYTTHDFHLSMFDGGHFYLNSQKSLLIDQIRIALRDRVAEIQ
jgi:medium-chain acyl-[acyl-carrier-protein] hydrolase